MLQRLLDLTSSRAGNVLIAPINLQKLVNSLFFLSLLPAVLTLMLRRGGDHEQLIEHFGAGNLQQGQGGRGTDLLCCCGRKYLSIGSRCALGSPSLCAFVLTPPVLFHLFFILHRLKQLPAWLCSEGGNGCWGWGRKQERANQGVGMRGHQGPLEIVTWQVP